MTHVCCCVSHTSFSWTGSTECHVWLQTVQLAPSLQAWSDRGERILMRWNDNTGCRLHGSRLQNSRNRSVPDFAQDDNKTNH